MNLSELIDQDIESMREYFNYLLKYVESDFKPLRVEESIYHPFGVKSLVLPDMACNIYSLVDYRLKTICKHRETLAPNSNKLKDFKKRDKESDFQHYTRYLENTFSLDFSSQTINIDTLNDLRIVRNTLIHNGGHYAPKLNEKSPEHIHGISLNYSLIVISEEFIWRSLDAAGKFLQEAAKTP